MKDIGNKMKSMGWALKLETEQGLLESSKMAKKSSESSLMNQERTRVSSQMMNLMESVL